MEKSFRDNLLANDTHDKPWVMLVRDPMCYTTAAYLERALAKLCNVIPINFDYRVWLPDSLGLYAEGVIRRLGLKVPIDLSKWIPPGMGKKIDLLLVVDPVTLPFNFKGFEGVKAYWAIDGWNPLTFEAHMKITRVDHYDHVFVAAKSVVQRYRESGCANVHWLPLACDPDVHKRYNLPIRYDVCFIGAVEWQGKRLLGDVDYDARERLVKMLNEKFSMFVGRRWLHDMAVTYSESKVVFNRSRLNDLNMRVFETLGCGRLLVTDRAKGSGLEDLFLNKKHLVFYDGIEDLIEIVRYYIDDEGEREEIALQGQREAYIHHTYLHRANNILSTIFGDTRDFLKDSFLGYESLKRIP